MPRLEIKQNDKGLFALLDGKEIPLITNIKIESPAGSLPTIVISCVVYDDKSETGITINDLVFEVK